LRHQGQECSRWQCTRLRQARGFRIRQARRCCGIEEEGEVGDEGLGLGLGGLCDAEGEWNAALDGTGGRAATRARIAFRHLVAGMHRGRDGDGSSSMGTDYRPFRRALPHWMHGRDAGCACFSLPRSA